MKFADYPEALPLDGTEIVLLSQGGFTRRAPLARTNTTSLGGNASGTLATGGNVSGTLATATGSTTARTLASRLSDRRSPKDWGAVMDGVTDDSVALAIATTALAGTGAVLEMPAGSRMLLGPAARLAGLTILLDGTGLQGSRARDSGAGVSGTTYGTRGSTILLTDTVGSPFTVARNWVIDGIIFFWPAQIEDASAPRVMPPLLIGDGVEVTLGVFIHNDVVNAYSVMDFSGGKCGGLQIHFNRAYFLNYFIKLKSMLLESFITTNQFSPNAYGAVVRAGPTFNLRTQSATLSSVLLIVGNGTATVASSDRVEGLIYSDNMVYGCGFGMRVLGGQIDFSTFSNNVFDATGTALSVETGGRVVEFRIAGGVWNSTTYGDATRITTAVVVSSDSCQGGHLLIDGVCPASGTGGLVDWNGAIGTLDMIGVQATGLNNLAGGTRDAVRFNSTAGGRLKAVGCRFYLQGGSTGGYGINVVVALQALTLIGNTFITTQAPLYVGGTSTAVVVVGNVSLASVAANAYQGAAAAVTPDVGNTWDKPSGGAGLSVSLANPAITTGYVLTSPAQADLKTYISGAGADAKYSSVFTSAAGISFRLLNDAYSVANVYFQVLRSGATGTTLNLIGGGSINLTAPAINLTGNTVLTTALAITSGGTGGNTQAAARAALGVPAATVGGVASKAGSFYALPASTNLAAALTADKVNFIPFNLAAGTITTINFQATAATIAGNVNLGIYSDVAGRPGALLASVAAIAVAATTLANKTGTLATPLAIATGQYWLAIQSDAAITTTGDNSVNLTASAAVGYGTLSAALSTLRVFLQSSDTYAAGLPASAPTVAILENSTTARLVLGF